jgi:MFS family permease
MTDTQQLTPAAAGRSRLRPASRRSPLPVVMCGTFMIVLDFFIVNVALPSMQADLHASASAIEWVVAGYGLTCAVLLIAAGRLGDLYGRRLAFAAGLAVFVVASAACGFAPSGVLPGGPVGHRRRVGAPDRGRVADLPDLGHRPGRRVAGWAVLARSA